MHTTVTMETGWWIIEGRERPSAVQRGILGDERAVHTAWCFYVSEDLPGTQTASNLSLRLKPSLNRFETFVKTRRVLISDKLKTTGDTSLRNKQTNNTASGRMCKPLISANRHVYMCVRSRWDRDTACNQQSSSLSNSAGKRNINLWRFDEGYLRNDVFSVRT